MPTTGRSNWPGCTKYVWQSKDGRRVMPHEMTSGHLCNTIRMLLRWAAKECEHVNRNTWVWDSEDVCLLLTREDVLQVVPTWEALVGEARARGLDYENFREDLN